jgi:fatty acid amide hydrolase 2
LSPLTSSATEMAAALRAGKISSRALVDAHIARIVAVNRRINAMVQFRFDEARLEADAADTRLATEDPKTLPPLLGVPCTIKENFAFPGFPQVSGMVARRNALATSEAPAVTRLRAAGAIVLGFSNTPELCMWMETNNKVYGRTGNPYDPARVAGGSSGGEGSLVGSGGSPFGLGADVGGSIRFPAFFNGVFGHKPTPGLVPNTGQYPLPEGEMNRNCVTGPIARRADDLWPLLKILAGPDGIDPVCGEITLRGDPKRVKLAKLRVFAVRDDGKREVADDLSAAQGRAAEWLGEQTGGGVTWLQPKALRHAFEIWSALMHATQPTPFAVLGLSPHTLPALVLALIDALPLPMGRYVEMGRALRAELIDTLGDDGVLLYPPYTRVAPKHNHPLLTPFDFAYCGIVNVLGLPSTQVPLGLNAQGLPLGVQVIAAPGRDAQTIAVARGLEQQFGGWVPPPDLAR